MNGDLRPRDAAQAGIMSLDADASMEKRQRANQLEAAGVKGPPETSGLGDFRIRRKSDPGNPLFMPVDPNKRAVGDLPRGSAASWSFAAAAYHLGMGTFQPLEWGNGNPNPPAPPAAPPAKLHPGLGVPVRPGGGTGQFGPPVPPSFNPNPPPPPPNHGPSDRANLDPDFGSLNVHTAHYGARLPSGVIAAMIATTHHGEKDVIGILSGGPLVADWRSPYSGDMSRWMMDIEMIDGSPVPARKRKAGLHSFVEVRSHEDPCGYGAAPSSQKYAIALVAKDAPDGTGNLLATFGPADGYLANTRSGPLIESLPWHQLFLSRDGSTRSASIATTAYFRYMKQVLPSHANVTSPDDIRLKTQPEIDAFGLDGPLEFVPDCWIPPFRGIYPWVSERRWDHRGSQHAFHCGPRLGLWRDEVWIDLAKTPGCEPTRSPIMLGVDTSGNPRRTVGRQSLFFPTALPLISSGIRFQPRAGSRHGRSRPYQPAASHNLGAEGPPQRRPGGTA